MSVAKILIAENKSAIGDIDKALRGYDIVQATTLTQAERLVTEDGIDLFVVGVHFDESQAMELLKFIRTESAHKNKPIIMVRLLQSEHVNLLRQSLEVMQLLHGINEYLELEGDPDAQKKMRQVVEKYVPAKK